jgi:hypothetical protein
MEYTGLLIAKRGTIITKALFIFSVLTYFPSILLFNLRYNLDFGASTTDLWKVSLPLFSLPGCLVFIYGFFVEKRTLYRRLFFVGIAGCFIISVHYTYLAVIYPNFFIFIVISGYIRIKNVLEESVEEKLYLDENAFRVYDSYQSVGFLSYTIHESGHTFQYDQLVECRIAEGKIQIRYFDEGEITCRKFYLKNVSDEMAKELLADKISNVKLRVLDELI